MKFQYPRQSIVVNDMKHAPFQTTVTFLSIREWENVDGAV